MEAFPSLPGFEPTTCCCGFTNRDAEAGLVQYSAGVLIRVDIMSGSCIERDSPLQGKYAGHTRYTGGVRVRRAGHKHKSSTYPIARVESHCTY